MQTMQDEVRALLNTETTVEGMSNRLAPAPLRVMRAVLPPSLAGISCDCEPEVAMSYVGWTGPGGSVEHTTMYVRYSCV